MPHIHTKPGEHDFTASAFIVRLDTPEPAVMLHRHKKTNLWLQFGGHVELDENPWQTVHHEVLEESGYAMSQLQLLQPVLRPPTTANDAVFHPQPLALQTHRFGHEDHFHTDTSFAFVTHEAPANPIAEGESDIMHMFTASELERAPDNEIPDNVRAIALYVLNRCLEEYEQVDVAAFAA